MPTKLIVALCLLAGPFAQSKPNLIFIMADDLGYGDLGCYGQKLIKTPRLDEMAKEGMKFTRFYSGSTVCAPSRSVLMTGQHMGHTHVRGNAGGDMTRQSLRDKDVTVAEVLKKAKYSTALIGKWGLGEIGRKVTHLAKASITSTAISTKFMPTISTLNSSGKTSTSRCSETKFSR